MSDAAVIDPDEADLATLTSAEMCERSGATYRQLDYWTRSGVIRAEYTDQRLRKIRAGPGSRRWYRPSDARRLAAIVAVSDLATGNHAGRSRLLAELGRADLPPGRWVIEHRGVRVTVQLVRDRAAA